MNTGANMRSPSLPGSVYGLAQTLTCTVPGVTRSGGQSCHILCILEDLPDSAGRIIQHACRPGLLSPRTAGNHHLVCLVPGQPPDAHLVAFGDDVELLFHRHLAHLPPACAHQGRAVNSGVSSPGEPVDVSVIAGHLTEKEVHRPATTQPHVYPTCQRHLHDLTDQLRLLSSTPYIHAGQDTSRAVLIPGDFPAPPGAERCPPVRTKPFTDPSSPYVLADCLRHTWAVTGASTLTGCGRPATRGGVDGVLSAKN